MAPFKSSLARSAGKLFGVFKERDLSLRGATQTDRVPPPGTFTFAMFGGGGSGGGWVAGGGGGGGYVEEESDIVTGVTYSVAIGAAGATPGSPTPQGEGNDGGNTTFVTPSGTFTAYGGGGAGQNNGAGRPGGSGGGSGGTSNSTIGYGNRVTGSPSNPASAAPPQPQVLSRVQGYDGGTYGPQPGGENSGGGGGAGGAGGTGTGPNTGGAGGTGITLSNFGPYNGTFGAGGGGSAAGGGGGSGGSPFAGDGVLSNQTDKNATGYANGGGGTREGGHAGGSATAGIFVLRVPNATTITSPGGSTSSAGGYNYLQRTTPGNITFS